MKAGFPRRSVFLLLSKISAALSVVAAALAFVFLLWDTSVIDTWHRSYTTLGHIALFVAVAMAIDAFVFGWLGNRRSDDAPRAFLPHDGERRVMEAIQSAERKTGAEIRVHLHYRLSAPIMEQAQRVFETSGMRVTEGRNGVLVFVSVKDREVAVVGDEAVDARVPQEFWSEVVGGVVSDFKQGRSASGLVEAIGRIGDELARHFPRQADDINELPDTISRSRPDADE